MKTAWIITAIAAVVAANAAEPVKRTITIHMVDHRKDGNYPLRLAERFASTILAGVNVSVEWHSGKPAETPSPNGTTFIVELTDRTPVDDHIGALAYALPYEGVHITLFFDRIRAMDANLPDAVLAHVLTHEITHMLEGVSRHSLTGVMKAQYTRTDVVAMRSKPLSFAKEDLILIDLGFRHRERMVHAAEAAAE